VGDVFTLIGVACIPWAFELQLVRSTLTSSAQLRFGGSSCASAGVALAASRIHVAPMMGHTDFCFRYLMRLISDEVVLWTEMVDANKLVFEAREGERKSVRLLLRQSDANLEPPTVLQLGGSSPGLLAEAVTLALPFRYTELNLNCGCPGKNVRKGHVRARPRRPSLVAEPAEATAKAKRLKKFVRDHAEDPCGAELMKDPALVRDCTSAMAEAAATAGVPVSVKCRIGVHDTVEAMRRKGDSYEALASFVGRVASAGHVRRFHVHARSAVLNGLDTEENRHVPPLRYDFVHRLAEDFPDLTFTLNGGIRSYADAEPHLKQGLDIMVGRWVLEDPWALRSSRWEHCSREDVLPHYLRWVKKQLGGMACQAEFLDKAQEPLFTLFRDRGSDTKLRALLIDLQRQTSRRSAFRR